MNPTQEMVRAEKSADLPDAPAVRELTSSSPAGIPSGSRPRDRLRGHRRAASVHGGPRARARAGPSQPDRASFVDTPLSASLLGATYDVDGGQQLVPA
jgi:hypothetical protein